MFTVERHTAPMTGAAWFIVTEDYDSHKVEGTDYFSDHEDAVLEAHERNKQEAYREAMQVFRDLLEQENLDEGFNNEYVRGGVNLIADLFGKPEMPIDERMDEVLAELRNMEIS